MAADTDPDTGRRLVYRPALSRVIFGIFVAFAGWWVAGEVIGTNPGHAVVTGLWLLAVSAALGCLFWRPAVLVNADGVELRNTVRDVWVPWPALEEIETRYALTLHADGRRFQSWAGSAPGRPSITGRVIGGLTGDGSATPASSRDLRADSGATAFMIEQRWQAWRQTPAATSLPGDGVRGVTGDGVRVSWRPLLPAVSTAAATLALVLTPLLP